MAIPRRKFRPFDSSREDFDRRKLGLSPPIISRICRESRAVARRTGKTFLLYSYAPDDYRDTVESYWTWFDRDRDILELCGDFSLGRDSLPLGVWKLFEFATSILVTASAVYHPWVWPTFRRDLGWSQKTIHIQRTQPEVAHRLRWSPEAIVKLFSHDEVYLLDLQDKAAIEHFCGRICSHNPQRQQLDFKLWLETYYNLEKDPEDMESFPNLKNLLECYWVCRGDHKALEEFTNLSQVAPYTWGRLDGFPEVGLRKALPEVQRRLVGMPRLRPVYVVEAEVFRGDINVCDSKVPIHPVHEFRDDMDYVEWIWQLE